MPPLFTAVHRFEEDEEVKIRAGLILLKKIKQLGAHHGGVLLPDLPRNLRGGEVVQLGERTTAYEVCVGDRVVVDHFTGVDFEWNGEKYLIVSEHDVLVYMRREDGNKSTT